MRPVRLIVVTLNVRPDQQLATRHTSVWQASFGTPAHVKPAQGTPNYVALQQLWARKLRAFWSGKLWVHIVLRKRREYRCPEVELWVHESRARQSGAGQFWLHESKPRRQLRQSADTLTLIALYARPMMSVF